MSAITRKAVRDWKHKLSLWPLNAGDMKVQGDRRERGARPWIGLYSGARLGEMAQLSTMDVRQLHGLWVMHITEEGSPLESTKTKGSPSVVPAHSELIKLGFIDYHSAIVARGEKQLSPEIKPDTRGFGAGCRLIPGMSVAAGPSIGEARSGWRDATGSG